MRQAIANFIKETEGGKKGKLDHFICDADFANINNKETLQLISSNETKTDDFEDCN